jgi:phospholipase C
MVARAAGISIIVGAGFAPTSFADDGGTAQTSTPIKHLVVIFQENVSFDHYFATYPVALNPPDEPFFEASDGTPSVNGLGTVVDGVPDGVLLTNNPISATRRTAPTRSTRSASIARRHRPATRITLTATSRRPSTKA